MSKRQAIIAELQDLVETQIVKYDCVLTATLAIPNGGSGTMIINVEQDADFLIQEITMAAYGPTDINGVPIGGGVGNTNFPTPANPSPIEIATRGLTMTWQDTGPGRFLIPFETPIELIATPGYGSQFYIPWKCSYLALRNSKQQFTFRNRDAAVSVPPGTPQFHFVEVSLKGKKFESYLGAK